MALQQLNIHRVRNIQAASLPRFARINVCFGENGSGKTSILEAIHLLGMARSFRGTSARTLITHGHPDCIVQGAVARSGGARKLLGVQRLLNGEVSLRVQGAPARAVSELVDHLPLQVINADSFALLTGSPPARRQYLNWGVFHVEHRFFPEWQRFQRCIKQRNSGLRRDRLADRELSVWTRELAESGQRLNSYRQAYFADLAPLFRSLMDRLLPQLGELELRLRQGWDKRLSYGEALAATLASDREKGFTQVGPQRADLKVVIDGRAAEDVLSRGQQKLVICGLKLAQGQLMQDRAQKQCIYLVDDLPSELDAQHNRRVCEELDRLGAQVFITCVAQDDLADQWSQAQDLAMFHVEHGEVTEQSFGETSLDPAAAGAK
ncbi:DNA replication/repair protein RecF [Parahaliea aestuarii]|uniref:DNA replication and repair protein RecF n=1 Tax=Parahaliea aestuarii TaxID=1852021 RepID=A0A5C8ZX64_9GAMM|nr:DNA replication/repair protein RecF [Parahaliea aestuarii]TXS92354.1 DNA replication/repair protein RecF [Parahaliea aestuarii]